MRPVPAEAFRLLVKDPVFRAAYNAKVRGARMPLPDALDWLGDLYLNYCFIGGAVGNTKDSRIAVKHTVGAGK
jgi:hypothetical protein